MFPFFMQPGDDPQDVHDRIHQAYAQRAMINEALLDDIKNFMDSMSAEHLATFRLIMHSIHHAPELKSITLAGYYEGQATALLHHKYNVCPSCGKDHAAEALAEEASD